jgi:glutamate dehydrogenase
MTQWFLRHGHKPLSIHGEVEHYRSHFAEVRKLLPKLMTTTMRNRHQARVEAWTKVGVPHTLAGTLADTLALACAADVSHSARYHKLQMAQVMPLYFAVGEALNFGKLHMAVDGITITNGWQRSAATAAHSKLYAAQKRLTGNMLKLNAKTPDAAITHWQEHHQRPLARYSELVASVTSTPQADFAMLNVLVDQLERLI